MTPTPDIGISYDKRIPKSIFDDFEFSIYNDRLSFHKEPREPDVFACAEWLIPTAVILFIGPYFGGFFGEMGKEHYHKLKKGILSLREKLWKENFVYIATPGKISGDHQYSIVFSILSKTKKGNTIKFLFDSNASPDTYEEIVESFLSLLSDYHSSGDDDYLTNELRGLDKVPHTVLIRYNKEEKKPEIIKSK